MKTIIIPSTTPVDERPLSPVQLRIENGSIIITGLPDDDVLDFVGYDKDGQHYIGHSPKDKQFEGNYRLHIGMPGKLYEATVKKFVRLRDGGTTTIHYENPNAGKIHWPSPLQEQEPPNGPYNHYLGQTVSIEFVDLKN